MYRWGFRMVVWTRFLWQVSNLDLLLTPTHPEEQSIRPDANKAVKKEGT